MRHDTPIRIVILLLALAVAVPAVQAALTIDAGGDRTVLAGEPVTILAVCNDTDALDIENMSASIDWGTRTTEPEIVLDDDRNATILDTWTYLAAGTYSVTVEVANNATGTVARDTLNVTVSPKPVEVKVAPQTLNQKSNGAMTIFVSLAEWFGFSDAGNRHATLPDPSAFTIGNATPERVNFCMKDGGTLILKYNRQDLDLAAGDNTLTVTGSLTGENGTIPVAGSGTVSVINPGNGNKGENGDGKEKVKSQHKSGEAEQQSGGKAKGKTQ
ncbi:hypothetical protein F8E02_08995 [Methanoculleus sp. Wushi-C6]|uniref:PKD domain-containing protein n=1 Tax=Methanoculleus caldifontis TaxID=2651577 RepID=A0ABU3X255_9EURY|nr:hypothetical protein [Methanoculleus sp. Wushi-C6]MDV2482130.1 hypothetical protein [Methanoculleus sp. Wushi-C6]